MAHVILDEGLYDREFVRRWVNWREYLRARRPGAAADVRRLHRGAEGGVRRATRPSTPSASSGVPAATIVEVAREIGAAARALRLATSGAAPAAGNLGGWQVARCLQFLSVLVGAVGTQGGTSPNALEQVRARRSSKPAAAERRGTSCSARASTRSRTTR